MGNYTDLLKMLAALVFVVSLMGGLALVLKRLGLGGPVAIGPAQKRLKIIEVSALDGRRRLVLLQRDDVQHLVILGPTTETVIETGIKPKDNQPHD
jgi:flagellar protein FliO/FliZ